MRWEIGVQREGEKERDGVREIKKEREREKEEHTVKWALKLVKQKHIH